MSFKNVSHKKKFDEMEQYQLIIKVFNQHHVAATNIISLQEREQKELINFVNKCIDNLQRNNVKGLDLPLIYVNWLYTKINNYVIQINTCDSDCLNVLYYLIKKINTKSVIPFKVFTKKTK